MSTTPNTTNREEWLKILGKGMVTIPKEWRDELGIKTGDVIKAKKEGSQVIFETNKNQLDDSVRESVFDYILEKTQGSWAADKSLDDMLKKRSLLEKKASQRRKNTW